MAAETADEAFARTYALNLGAAPKNFVLPAACGDAGGASWPPIITSNNPRALPDNKRRRKGVKSNDEQRNHYILLVFALMHCGGLKPDLLASEDLCAQLFDDGKYSWIEDTGAVIAALHSHYRNPGSRKNALLAFLQLCEALQMPATKERYVAAFSEPDRAPNAAPMDMDEKADDDDDAGDYYAQILGGLVSPEPRDIAPVLDTPAATHLPLSETTGYALAVSMIEEQVPHSINLLHTTLLGTAVAALADLMRLMNTDDDSDGETPPPELRNPSHIAEDEAAFGTPRPLGTSADESPYHSLAHYTPVYGSPEPATAAHGSPEYGSPVRRPATAALREYTAASPPTPLAIAPAITTVDPAPTDSGYASDDGASVASTLTLPSSDDEETPDPLCAGPCNDCSHTPACRYTKQYYQARLIEYQEFVEILRVQATQALDSVTVDVSQWRYKQNHAVQAVMRYLGLATMYGDVGGTLEPNRLDWYCAQFVTALPAILPDRCMYVLVTDASVVVHLRGGNKNYCALTQDISAHSPLLADFLRRWAPLAASAQPDEREPFVLFMHAYEKNYGQPFDGRAYGKLLERTWTGPTARGLGAPDPHAHARIEPNAKDRHGYGCDWARKVCGRARRGVLEAAAEARAAEGAARQGHTAQTERGQYRTV